MLIKSVVLLLVAIFISASSVSAQIPMFPPFRFPFPFPFSFPFPNPFHPNPGGMPGFPGIPGFLNPFQPSPGSMPGFPNIPGFPNPFQPSPGSMPGTPGMPETPNSMPGIPNPEMPGIPDLNKCWSSEMKDLPGCVAEIIQSIMTGKYESIGPACCKAFLDAEANCSHNLPFDPFFPPMIKQKCSQSAGPPTTLP